MCVLSQVEDEFSGSWGWDFNTAGLKEIYQYKEVAGEIIGDFKVEGLGSSEGINSLVDFDVAWYNLGPNFRAARCLFEFRLCFFFLVFFFRHITT